MRVMMYTHLEEQHSCPKMNRTFRERRLLLVHPPHMHGKFSPRPKSFLAAALAMGNFTVRTLIVISTLTWMFVFDVAFKFR